MSDCIQLGIAISDMIDVIIPPDETWTVKGSAWHQFEFTFRSGVLGKTLPQLLGMIGRAYDDESRRRPTIKWEDEELGSGEVPFWGDHNFLEIVKIHKDTRVVELFFGS